MRRPKKEWFEVVESGIKLTGVCESQNRMKGEDHDGRPQIFWRETEGKESEYIVETSVQMYRFTLKPLRKAK